jgi:hypothetical protein
MAEVNLESLRTLRRRADSLLQTLGSDLYPFRHTSVSQGFLRTPESPVIADDVNVTTTCSCLMALALTGKISQFYEKDAPDTVAAVFRKLIDAPWMSSGLAENNAFTTTLILRTMGFLVASKGLPRKVLTPAQKGWEPHIEIAKFKNFAAKLTAAKRTPISELLFSLMPNGVQRRLREYIAGHLSESDIKRDVTNEVSRIVRTTALYTTERFDKVTLSKASRALLDKPSHAYTTAQLNRLLLDDAYPGIFAAIRARSISYIAKTISADPARFAINEYSSSAAVMYWFVDGITRAEITLPKKNWDVLCVWATDEFTRQRSLVVAQHAAMMDPIAMAMAACLCAKLRGLSNGGILGLTSAHQAKLPSVTELEESILELFELQTSSGIWPKYFPLFHYQEAGSNFCFTFELLEAVLTEFSGADNRLVDHPNFVNGLELAVTWCERNRLRYTSEREKKQLVFTGWNSGGFVNSLRKGQPESWATAVVHMFLWELSDVLSRRIQHRLTDAYIAKRPTDKLDRLLDIEIWIDGQHVSLKEILRTSLVDTFKNQTERSLRAKPAKGRVSALLFGPPGTSKTQIAKAIAAELGWELIQVDPSHFLRSSLENIYVQAERIFEDIADLSGVVVLFDELDALVQTRYGDRPLDTEGRFLTTYMLPKLASLHDRGRILFLMATNFQDVFDDAIKRAGRFDLLLCMGPPTLRAKCDSIHAFFGSDAEPNTQTKKAGETLLKFTDGNVPLRQQLELYTFGEFKNLISTIGTYDNIGTAVSKLGRKRFAELVSKDTGTVMLKFDELQSLLEQHSKATVAELDSAPIAFTDELLKKRVIRYVRDRRESKRQ